MKRTTCPQVVCSSTVNRPCHHEADVNSMKAPERRVNTFIVMEKLCLPSARALTAWVSDPRPRPGVNLQKWDR